MTAEFRMIGSVVLVLVVALALTGCPDSDQNINISGDLLGHPEPGDKHTVSEVKTDSGMTVDSTEHPVEVSVVRRLDSYEGKNGVIAEFGEVGSTGDSVFWYVAYEPNGDVSFLIDLAKGPVPSEALPPPTWIPVPYGSQEEIVSTLLDTTLTDPVQGNQHIVFESTSTFAGTGSIDFQGATRETWSGSFTIKATYAGDQGSLTVEQTTDVELLPEIGYPFRYDVRTVAPAALVDEGVNRTLITTTAF
jgi:hypothetical protein